MATFDMTALTLGEVAYIEDLAAQPITALDDPAAPKGKLIAAFYLVAQRRSGNPTYTFNRALDVPMDEAARFLGISGDEAENVEEAIEAGKDVRSDVSESADEQSSSSPSVSL